jgi:hypothetical protein
MRLAATIALTTHVLLACAIPAVAQIATTARPEQTAGRETPMPYAVGPIGGASSRGAQVGVRVNAGLGRLSALTPTSVTGGGATSMTRTT